MAAAVVFGSQFGRYGGRYSVSVLQYNNCLDSGMFTGRFCGRFGSSRRGRYTVGFKVDVVACSGKHSTRYGIRCCGK